MKFYSLKTKFLAICPIANGLDVGDQNDEFKSYDEIVLKLLARFVLKN